MSKERLRFSELPDDIDIEDLDDDIELIIDDDEPEFHDEFWEDDED